MSVLQVLVLLLVAGVVVSVFLMAAGVMAARADRATMRHLGCYCEAGNDGLHLPGCPLARDESDEAGA